ncbi:uncharacterized protein LOC129761315 [Toxorhynchites rutilus septentrionalis]|uniref:uncharacterized protein LOC129761315 n=1 Tax=Toxorhynchites rutilus septentrionalis TaxID=329112 RepID=UPI002478B67D|nr:uncharacterized protein LOC129761315 [Toxorhynchites rutilus septentrionalis]
MYRQILVARVLWRESPSDPLRVLQLNTVTYGTASAPFRASRCLMKLAEDEAAETPSAARVLQEDFYMDDALSGADTIDDAVDIQQQLQKLRSKEECREKQMSIPEYGANEAIKLLGLLWDPRNDIFFITNPFRQQATNDNVTKRSIFSEISKLFDPIGIIAPVIVTAKLLVQQLWKAKLEWDESVNIECLHQWKELKTELPLLTHINVPRCVTFDNVVSFSLHGFADASSVAYGAYIYLRNEFADGSAKLRLLSSKSKVAPLHELSIPRKELCAALLLTRLLQRVIPALQMEMREIVLWSGSTIVLAWMRKPLDQLQQFVRNRIAEIRKFTAECQWNYIRSQSNPADIVTRGQLPEALSQNYLWWNGPKFLEGPDYPVDEIAHVPDQLLPELTVVVATSTLNIEPLSFLHKHNNFRKLQRIMSYIIRFVDNCRQKNPLDRRKSNHHTVIELRRSTDAIFKILQHIHLSDEIQRVLSNQPCKRIGNLRPVYNEGLLRVGGRLDHSTLPFASKHQIILPDKDPITKAFIRTMHDELPCRPNRTYQCHSAAILANPQLYSLLPNKSDRYYTAYGEPAKITCSSVPTICSNWCRICRSILDKGRSTTSEIN